MSFAGVLAAPKRRRLSNAVVYGLRNLANTNRYETAVDGGEPGIAGSSTAWGMIFAVSLTSAGSEYSAISQRGGLFGGGGNNGWSLHLSDRQYLFYVYDGSGPTGSVVQIGDVEFGKIQLLCFQQLANGKFRAFCGYTKSLSDTAVVSFSPATGVKHVVGSASAGQNTPRQDFFSEASFSGEMTLANWCNFVDAFKTSGSIPASLAAYGVTKRHQYSVADDSIGGTAVPASLTDSGTPGGSNASKVGTGQALQTYVSPAYSFGAGAEDVWAAFGDSLCGPGTGLDAALPVDYPNATSQIGTLWQYSEGGVYWAQSRQVSNQVGLDDMFAHRRSQLTNRPVGVVNRATGGTTTTDWALDTGGFRTLFSAALNAAMTVNPRGTVKFLCTLGTNGQTDPAPPDWGAQMDSILSSLISAATFTLPGTIDVVYYILRATNPNPAWLGNPILRAMQLAKSGTTSSIGGKTVRWTGVEMVDNAALFADSLHPTTAGYDAWGTLAAAASTFIT